MSWMHVLSILGDVLAAILGGVAALGLAFWMGREHGRNRRPR